MVSRNKKCQKILQGAIIETPEFLILDEPMNGLDNNGVSQMRQLFLKSKNEKKTILLASHNREDPQEGEVIPSGFFQSEKPHI